MLIFEGTTNLNELVKHICDQTNLYGTQNGREFATNPDEIRVFLGINYIMSILKLPNVKCYWSVDSYLSNDGVRNAMTRNRFMSVLQNLHFTDNQNADKSYNTYKMRIVINHVNKAFQDAMPDAERQSIDGHMTKCKVRMSKGRMKNKPKKCVSSGGVNAAAKQDICMSLIFILIKRKKQSLGLSKQVFWICLRN